MNIQYNKKSIKFSASLIQAVTFILVAVTVLTSTFMPYTACAETDTEEFSEETEISYILIETDRNQQLAKQNTEATVDASLLARMMTCLIALENLSLTDTVTAEEASNSYTDGYQISAGKSYSVDTLVKAALTGNADNAARLLADEVCKKKNCSIDEFITLMNDTASLFKMSSTVFANADGASNEFQRTTVYDTALFIANAVKDTRFKSIYCAPAVLIWDNIIISNPNNTVITKSETGDTAGGTLATYSNDDLSNSYTSTFYLETNSTDPTLSCNLVLVISGAHREAVLEYENLILEDFENNYKKVAVVTSGDVIDTISTEKNELILISGTTAYAMVPSDQTSYVSNISYIYEENYDPESITPPIEAGTIIGYAQYLLNDGTSFQVPMVSKNTIISDTATVNTVYSFFSTYRELFVSLGVLAIIEVILILYNIYWFIQKKRYNKRNKTI